MIRGSTAWIEQEQQRVKQWQVELELLEAGSWAISRKVRNDPELAEQLAEELGIGKRD